MMAGEIRSSVPVWATKAKADTVTRPSAPEFKLFTQALAKRFAGNNVMFSIWNEPNLSVEWTGKTNHKEYVAFQIQVAKAIRSIDTLRFLVPLLEQPAYAQQACLTVVELAHHSGLRESHKEEFHRVLDQVIALSKDATVIDRARRYKTGQTWVRPKSDK